MMYNVHVAALIQLILNIGPVLAQKNLFCPKTDETNDVPLQWSRDLATLAYGCIAEYIELHCCVEGSSSLLWYERRSGEKNWALVRSTNAKYLSNPSNQTLIIKGTDPDRDEGDYGCAASDDKGNTIINNITLRLIECEDWHDKPVILEPVDQETTYEVFPGDNFSVACSVFYGNCQSVFSGCYVDWLRIYNDSKFELIQEGNASDRVYTQKWKSKAGLKNIGERQTLHINNVDAADFGHYKCWAYSSYGSTPTDVYLKRKYKPVGSGIIIVSCVLAFLVVLVLASLVTWKKKGLDIKLKFKDTCRRRSPEEARTYDAAILHADEDSDFVDEILGHTLTEIHQYKLFTHRDVGYNETYWNAFGRAQEESHCFIFIISPDFFEDAKCINFIHQVIAEEFRNFIFVIYKPITREKEAQLCNDKPGDNLEIIFRAIKVCRKFKWPAENDQGQQNEEKLNLFWKRLRYELPAKVQIDPAEHQPNDVEACQENAEHDPVVHQPNDIEACGENADQLRGLDINKNRAKGQKKTTIASDSSRPLLQSNDSHNVPNDVNNDAPAYAAGNAEDTNNEDDVFAEEGEIQPDKDKQFQSSGESRDTGIGESV